MTEATWQRQQQETAPKPDIGAGPWLCEDTRTRGAIPVTHKPRLHFRKGAEGGDGSRTTLHENPGAGQSPGAP